MFRYYYTRRVRVVDYVLNRCQTILRAVSFLMNLFQIAYVGAAGWRPERQRDCNDPSNVAQDIGHHQVQAVSGEEHVFNFFFNYQLAIVIFLSIANSIKLFFLCNEEFFRHSMLN